MSRRLLYCGLVAGPLFVLTFLLEGVFKDDGYEVLRHPGQLLGARAERLDRRP